MGSAYKVNRCYNSVTGFVIGITSKTRRQTERGNAPGARGFCSQTQE